MKDIDERQQKRREEEIKAREEIAALRKQRLEEAHRKLADEEKKIESIKEDRKKAGNNFNNLGVEDQVILLNYGSNMQNIFIQLIGKGFNRYKKDEALWNSFVDLPEYDINNHELKELSVKELEKADVLFHNLFGEIGDYEEPFLYFVNGRKNVNDVITASDMIISNFVYDSLSIKEIVKNDADKKGIKLSDRELCQYQKLYLLNHVKELYVTLQEAAKVQKEDKAKYRAAQNKLNNFKNDFVYLGFYAGKNSENEVEVIRTADDYNNANMNRKKWIKDNHLKNISKSSEQDLAAALGFIKNIGKNIIKEQNLAVDETTPLGINRIMYELDEFRSAFTLQKDIDDQDMGYMTFCEDMAVLCDCDRGNLGKLMRERPYIANMLKFIENGPLTISGKTSKEQLEEISKDEAADIALETYFNLTHDIVKLIQAEYVRQNNNMQGWTPKNEVLFKNEFYKAEEAINNYYEAKKSLEPLDKYCVTPISKYFDRDEKNNILYDFDVISSERNAIEGGFSPQDTFLLGVVSVVNTTATRLYNDATEPDMKAKYQDISDNLKVLHLKLAQSTNTVERRHYLEQFDLIMMQNADNKELLSYIEEHQLEYDEAMNNFEKSYKEHIIRELNINSSDDVKLARTMVKMEKMMLERGDTEENEIFGEFINKLDSEAQNRLKKSLYNERLENMSTRANDIKYASNVLLRHEELGELKNNPTVIDNIYSQVGKITSKKDEVAAVDKLFEMIPETAGEIDKKTLRDNYIKKIDQNPFEENGEVKHSEQYELFLKAEKLDDSEAKEDIGIKVVATSDGSFDILYDKPIDEIKREVLDKADNRKENDNPEEIKAEENPEDNKEEIKTEKQNPEDNKEEIKTEEENPEDDKEGIKTEEQNPSDNQEKIKAEEQKVVENKEEINAVNPEDNKAKIKVEEILENNKEAIKTKNQNPDNYAKVSATHDVKQLQEQKNNNKPQKTNTKQRLAKRQKQYLTQYNVFRNAKTNDLLYYNKKKCADAFKKLNDMISALSPFDKKGNRRTDMPDSGKLTDKQLALLINQYTDTINVLHELNMEAMKVTKRSDLAEKKRKKYELEVNSYNFLADTLSKDLSAMKNVSKANESIDLHEIYERSRVRSDFVVVELPDSVNKGNLNERIQMTVRDKDNNLIRGYFTVDKTIPADNYVEEAFLSAKKKYEGYGDMITLALIDSYKQSLFEMIEDKGNKVPNFKGINLFNLITNSKENLMMYDHKKCVKLFNEACSMDISLYIDTPGKLKAFVDIASEVYNARNKKEFIDAVGIGRPGNVNRRNAAMSKMAELLGCSDLIAYSENVKINVNGQMLKGTFMKEAEGEDSKKLTEESSGLTGNLGTVENLKLKKQIANLQILDYLCGNVDRHGANMLYKFEKAEDGSVVLVSICGIDNDSSFGENNVDNSASNAFVPLEAMCVITEEMAGYIMDLDEEGLKSLFYGYELNTASLDNMKKRLKNLKEKIIDDSKEYEKGYLKGGIKPGKIKIVSDDELNELSIEHDLSVSYNNGKCNLFYKVATFSDGKQNINILQDRVKSDYCKYAYNATVGGIGELDELVGRLNRDNKWGGTSEGYEKMLERMKLIKPQIMNFDANVLDGDMKKHCEKLEEIRGYLTEALVDVNEYILYKLNKKNGESLANIKDENKASRSERRYLDAVACREFLGKQLMEFEKLDRQLITFQSLKNNISDITKRCNELDKKYHLSEQYKKIQTDRETNLRSNHGSRTAYKIKEMFDKYKEFNKYTEKLISDNNKALAGEKGEVVDNKVIEERKAQSAYLSALCERDLGYGIASASAMGIVGFRDYLKKTYGIETEKSVDELLTRSIASDFVTLKYDLSNKKDVLTPNEQIVYNVLEHISIEPVEGAVDRLCATKEFKEFAKKAVPIMKTCTMKGEPGSYGPNFPLIFEAMKLNRNIYIAANPDKMTPQEKTAKAAAAKAAAAKSAGAKGAGVMKK